MKIFVSLNANLLKTREIERDEYLLQKKKKRKKMRRRRRKKIFFARSTIITNENLFIKPIRSMSLKQKKKIATYRSSIIANIIRTTWIRFFSYSLLLHLLTPSNNDLTGPSF